ncbi:MAG TPA: methylmalonyl Co-A mutase-associated GTPase MeaB [Bacteroidales bacterium]|nr:methylmalonyl Co-A mutase-associated GTPase MeaB [Bacteroidales bacterium]
MPYINTMQMEHTHEEEFKSALSVQDGVEQPPSVNEHSVLRFLKKTKKNISTDEYISGILAGNRTMLSQAITLVESSLPAHQKTAQEIIEKCLPHSGKSIRIGITGVPGVGKSTFIESFGMYVTSLGKKLAVLAIDPSSERSKGSILGDKTRMEELSINPDAFIRPSPSAGSLGGVARKTRETIILCEAAGFDTIFIETVGVGQSETAVHSMVDFFLLLMLSGAGDELQGIKRGIMEMADTIAITKADGSNIQKAELAATQYRTALHLFPKSPSGWVPNVLTCSSVTGAGIENLWKSTSDYLQLTKANEFFTYRRLEQAKYWMYETINESLKSHFYNNPDIEHDLPVYEQLVLEDKMSSFTAARHLLKKYMKHGKLE